MWPYGDLAKINLQGLDNMATRSSESEMKISGSSATAPNAGDIMDQYRGGPGFDWLRIGLSLGVILLHSFHTAYGPSPYLAENWSSPIWAFILPAFFAASGFMVAGSAMRTRDVKVFMGFRGLRIVPALAVETFLCAFLLGPIITSLTISQYFSSFDTYEYMGNIVGYIQYDLPGVFLENPRPGMVNQNLWTLHAELASYILMAALMVSRLVYSQKIMLWLWAFATVAIFIANINGTVFLTGVFKPTILIYSFFSGVVLYHYRYKIKISSSFFIFSVICAYAFFKTPFYLAALPFTFYIMIFVGMKNFPRVKWLQNGDYSYGLYLYGYPIQQLTVMYLPEEARSWWLVFIIAVPITFGISYFSWNYVEKPTLKLKNYLKKPTVEVRSLTHPPAGELGNSNSQDTSVTP